MRVGASGRINPMLYDEMGSFLIRNSWLPRISWGAAL